MHELKPHRNERPRRTGAGAKLPSLLAAEKDEGLDEALDAVLTDASETIAKQQECRAWKKAPLPIGHSPGSKSILLCMYNAVSVVKMY